MREELAKCFNNDRTVIYEQNTFSHDGDDSFRKNVRYPGRTNRTAEKVVLPLEIDPLCSLSRSMTTVFLWMTASSVEGCLETCSRLCF